MTAGREDLLPDRPEGELTMGLFENLGRKVERFKQAAEDAAEEEASHRCEDCGEPYYTDQDACPECGGDVVAVEPAVEEEADSTDDGASADESTSGDESAPTDESNAADATTDGTAPDEATTDGPEDGSGA